MAAHRKRSFARGLKSKAMDDRSGFEVPYKDLRKEWTGHRVHKDDWEPKHPQLEPRSVVDAEALRNPRPNDDGDLTKVVLRRGVGSTGIIGNELDQATGNVTAGIAGSLGSAGTTALGTVSITVAVAPEVTGISATGAIGTEIPTAQATPSGISATGAIGTVTGSATAVPSGVAGTGAIGTEIPTAQATPSGVSATGALGNEAPQAADLSSGVAGTGAIGGVTLDIDSSVWGSDAWGANEWGN